MARNVREPPPPEIFVGRQEALASLRASLERSLTGSTQLFLIQGEPGIGKTRLGDELASEARARGVQVLIGRCPDDGAAPAYWPWIQILRAWARSRRPAAARRGLGDLAADVQGWLGSPAAAAITDSERGRFRFFDRLSRFFERQTRRSPLLLLFDDLHWADRASLHLLRFLGREIREARLLILGLYRDTDVAPRSPLAGELFDVERDATSLRLTGLSAAEVAELVAHGTGIAPPPTLAAALAERSGGNPLFLGELLRSWASQGQLDLGRALRGDLPPGVREIVHRRIAALPEDARGHLERASVLGRDFATDVLAAMAEVDRDTLETSLRPACEAHLLAPSADDPDRLVFSHSLVRDALYDALDPERRSRWHRRAATAIASRGAGDAAPQSHALAHHLLRSGRADDLDAAVDHASAGAELAMGRFAYEDAAAQLELALRALDRLDRERDAPDRTAALRRAEIVARLADARWSAGEHGRARETFLDLAALARRIDAPATLARAAMGYAGKADPDFQPVPERVRLLEEALAALPREDSATRAWLLSSYASRLYLTSERERGIEMAHEAVAIAERIADRDALLGALSALHYTLLGPSPVAARRALARRIQALAWERDSTWYRLWGHFWCVLDALELGEVTESDTEMVAFASLAEEFRDPFFLWQAASLRAMRAVLAGRLAEGERLATEAFALAQRAESPNAALGFATQLIAIRRAQGRSAELVDLVREMADRMPAQPGIQVVIAVLCAESGRIEEAHLALERTFAHDLEDHPRDVHWAGLLYYSALAIDALSDRPRAERVYELLRPLDGRCVIYSLAVAAEGAVAHGLGLLARVLGRDEDAERHFADAIRMNQRMGARPALGRACLDAAALALERGDTAAGRQLLDRATDTFAALGMPAHLERARALEARFGHIVPVAAPGRSRNLFQKRGELWDLSFGGETVRLQDRKGLSYLRALLREPNREMHVLDLVTSVEGAPPQPAMRLDPADGLAIERGAGEDPTLDPTSRARYRARLREIADEAVEAETSHDLGRLDRLRAEKDFLEAELAQAFGLGGRSARRRDPGERARKAVYNRIKSTIEQIHAAHSRLGRHLAASVRTGRICVYRPEAPTEWETD